MKFVFSAIFLFMFSLTAAAAADKPASDCIDKCETAKKSCMAQYTKSDSTSGKYVTPEGHKICWQGYHDCKKQCPKGGK